MTIDELNRLPEDDAFTAFEQCCGASQWVERMVFSRPFEDFNEVMETCDNIWEECDVDDYEEAFSFYPRIGDPEELEEMRNAGAGLEDLGLKWAAMELKGLEDGPPEVQEELAKANAEYEDKFGYVFVICAPGKNAVEIIAAIRERLRNGPAEEIYVAAAEQHKITHVRLKKLLA